MIKSVSLFFLGALVMACCGGNSCNIVLADDISVASPPKPQIVIQFSAEWCGPCRKLKSVMKSDDMKKWLKDNEVRYYHIDVDKDRSKSAAKAWIKYASPTSIPLVVKYEWNNEKWVEVKKFTGAKSADSMKEWLKK
jgi:thiol:disulfide interchange protein